MINRTMTLREDSDIVARHGLVERRETPLTMAEIRNVYSQEPRRPGHHFLPENRVGRRKLPAPIAWFVSHCNDFNGRMKYVLWLKKYIRVDIIGDCGPKSCGKNKNMGHQYSLHEDPCFKMVNKNYRFYIAFENALCKDYVTEKVILYCCISFVKLWNPGFQFFATEYNPYFNGRRELLEDPPAWLLH